jgi:hypothetical protein
MRKRTLITVHVRFSALLPTTLIIFLRCGSQCGKMIGIVAYTAENISVLLTTTQKNVFEFEYVHEFETLCEFILGFQSRA